MSGSALRTPWIITPAVQHPPANHAARARGRAGWVVLIGRSGQRARRGSKLERYPPFVA